MKTKNYYILLDEKRLNNCKAYIDSLPLNGKIEVVIQKYKKRRSNAQNRLMWMWLDIIADFTGDDVEELHKKLKVRWLGTKTELVEGVMLRFPKSTADLEPWEFSKHLTKIEALARWLELTLPKPDDYNYIMGY